MASKQMPVEFEFSNFNIVGSLTLNAEIVELLSRNPNYHIAFAHMRNDDDTFDVVAASVVDNNNFLKDVKNKES